MKSIPNTNPFKRAKRTQIRNQTRIALTESKKIIITDSILNLAKIHIQLLEKSVTLKEVVIGNNKSIFYVDKDIMSHNAPIVNARTLNLPYANTKIEKDNSLLKVNSGFALSFDGILNRMSGSYKRAKIAKKLLRDIANSIARSFNNSKYFLRNLVRGVSYVDMLYAPDKNYFVYKTFKIIAHTQLNLKIYSSLNSKVNNN